jgi:hypothetical protein
MTEDRLFKRTPNLKLHNLRSSIPRGVGVVINSFSSISNSHKLQLKEKKYCMVAKYVGYFNTIIIYCKRKLMLKTTIRHLKLHSLSRNQRLHVILRASHAFITVCVWGNLCLLYCHYIYRGCQVFL